MYLFSQVRSTAAPAAPAPAGGGVTAVKLDPPYEPPEMDPPAARRSS